VNSFYYLLMNAGIFIVLTWYLDKVLITGEHGSSKPWYFPFTLEYWGCGSTKKSNFSVGTGEAEDVDEGNNQALSVFNMYRCLK
jgi:hypothetical protein